MKAKAFAMMGFVTLISACSGSSSDGITSSQDEYDALIAEVTGLRQTVDRLDQTTFVDLPVSGSATYDGFAVLGFDNDRGGAGLVGEARITANFDNDTLTGQASGFFGAVAGDNVTAFTGVLSISDGRIDPAQADPLSAGMSGRLTSGADVVVVDSTLTGEFRGEPRLIGEAPEALIMEGGAGNSFTVNGTEVSGDIEVITID